MAQHFKDYLVKSEINSGAMGTILLAEKDKKTYAIKIIKKNTEDLRARFRKEAASVARLSSPFIPKIFDFGEHESNPFMIMEFVPGKNLSNVIEEKELQLDSVLKIIKQVVNALKVLHASRLVHRDIKPENIMVDGDSAKLIDLGLVSSLEDLRENPESVGTMAYASPEQNGMLRRPVDERSDLYSLGVTLYHCLEGRLPFISEDFGEIMRMHMADTAPAIGTQRPVKSQVLKEIVEKLMAKDPDDRYQSSSGLLWDLEHLHELDQARAGGQPYKIGSRDFELATEGEIPLVGRDAELENLCSYIDTTLEKKVTALLIVGESGGGKSRLAREVMKKWKTKNLPSGYGKAELVDNNSPLASMREALDGLAGYVAGRSDVESLQVKIKEKFGESAGFIRWLSKPLAESFGVAEMQVKSEIDELQILSSEFLSFLATLFGGLSIYIDDIQWIDPISSKIISGTLNKFPDAPLMMMFSSRNDQDSVDALNKFVDMCNEKISCRLELPELGRDAVRKLISYSFGGRPVADVLVNKVVEVAGANPLVVTEYCRSLLEAGACVLKDDSWVLSEGGFDLASVSNDIFALFQKRLKRLDEHTFNLVLAAALTGNKFSLSAVRKAIALPEAEGAKSASNAVFSNLIVQDDNDIFRFVHDRVRESALALIDPAARQRMSEQLMSEFESHQDSSDEHKFLCARLAMDAVREGNENKVFMHCFDAGKAALGLLTYARAVEYLSFGAKLNEEHKVQIEPRNLIKFFDAYGTSLLEAGDAELAIKYIDLGVAECSDRIDIARFCYLRIRAFGSSGRLNEAWLIYLDALEVLGVKWPRYIWPQLLAITFLMPMYYICTHLGLFKDRLKKKGREKDREFAIAMLGIYEEGSFITAFQASLFEHFVICYRMLLLDHFAGVSRFSAPSHYVYFPILGIFRAKKLVKFHSERTNEVATLANDLRGLAVGRNHTILCDIYLDRNLPTIPTQLLEVKKFVDRYAGTYQITQVNGEMHFMYMLLGKVNEALASYRMTLEQNVAAKQRLMNTWDRHMAYMTMSILGFRKEGADMRMELAQYIAKETLYIRTAHSLFPLAELMVSYFNGDIRPELDDHISMIHAFQVEQYYNILGYVVIGYIELERLLQAPPDQQLEAEENVKKAMRKLWRSSYSKLFRTHLKVIEAGYATYKGRFSQAEALFDRAEKATAEMGGNNFLTFEICFRRAILFFRQGKADSGRAFASAARELCIQYGWITRIGHVEKYFNLPPLQYIDPAAGETTKTKISKTRVRPSPNATTAATVTSMNLGARESNYIQALLQVSEAFSSSQEPQEQIQSSLDEIVRVLGAERGFIFYAEDENNKMDVQTKEAQP